MCTYSVHTVQLTVPNSSPPSTGRFSAIRLLNGFISWPPSTQSSFEVRVLPFRELFDFVRFVLLRSTTFDFVRFPSKACTTALHNRRPFPGPLNQQARIAWTIAISVRVAFWAATGTSANIPDNRQIERLVQVLDDCRGFYSLTAIFLAFEKSFNLPAECNCGLLCHQPLPEREDCFNLLQSKLISCLHSSVID